MTDTNHDLEADLLSARLAVVLARTDRDRALGREPARDDMARAYRYAHELAYHAKHASRAQRTEGELH